MSEKEDGPDPLVAAIGDFRQELVGWIDSLLESERGRHSGMAARPRGLTEEPPGPVGRTETRLDSGSAPRERPAISADNQADGSEPPKNHDPRHRLDALARLLGERLRNSEVSRGAPDRPEGEGKVQARTWSPARGSSSVES